MFDVGFTELMLLAIIGMVVIGPERLPGVARTVGRGVGQAKRAMHKFQRKLEDEVGLDDIDRPVRGKAAPDAPPSDEVEPPLNPRESSGAAPTKGTGESGDY
jgi:sec-independent protein translocase protein TatB